MAEDCMMTDALSVVVASAAADEGNNQIASETGGMMKKAVDIEHVLSSADDLVDVLKNPNDIDSLFHLFQFASQLRDFCNKDQSDITAHTQDVQERIDICKEQVKNEENKSEFDEELQMLQNDLGHDLQTEEVLHQELRILTEQVDEMDRRRDSIEDRMKVLKNVQKENSRGKSEISMYASITKVLPDMQASTIAGALVGGDKSRSAQFDFDPSKMSMEEISNCLWEMGD